MKAPARIVTALVTLAAVAWPGVLLVGLVRRSFAGRPVVLVEMVRLRPGAVREPAPAPLADGPQVAARPAPAEAGLDEDELGQRLARIPAAVSGRAAALDGRPLATAGREPSGAKQPQAVEIPRADRWQVYVGEGITTEEYARQLDFFNIELGTASGPGEIEYAFHLTKPTPERRTGTAAADERLYMSWRRGDLAEADRRLMAAAGINVAGQVVVLFYPAALEEKLAGLEKEFAGRDPQAILRTRFGIRRVGEGYEFYVIDQSPLR